MSVVLSFSCQAPGQPMCLRQLLQALSQVCEMPEMLFAADTSLLPCASASQCQRLVTHWIMMSSGIS